MSTGLTEIEMDMLPVKPETKELNIQDALLQIVQRTDIDPERLEKFLDLQIKMENRQAERAFNEAMANFQAKCPIIKKTRKIDFQSSSGKSTKYNYSPLDEIIHIIKPILGECGLSYAFDIEPGEKTSILKVDISHKDGFSKTFQMAFETIHEDTRMNLSQRRKSAVTYTKRGLLENALGIVTTEEDDDARRATDTSVSAEQLAEIDKHLKLTNTDKSSFLKFLMVDSLEDLSAHDAKKAINAFKAKRTKNIK